MTNNKIVAEIEKYYNECLKRAKITDSDYWNAKAEAYRNVLVILYATLEVKNVKKESMSDDLEEAIGQSFIYHERRGNDFRSDKQIETAYKYGFETGVKWANEHSIEVKEVDLNKEIKDYFNNQPIITRSKGVDYRLIPSGEEIAKHFFELGLKA